MSSIRALSFSGKYLATYISPTASERVPLGTDMARFQRGFCSCLPDITRPKKSNDALMKSSLR